MYPELAAWQKSVDARMDRILNELDFIKNRTAVYLGGNEALTWLADETPIFINTDDSGCPMNFLNGGRYEEDNFSLLLSYRKPGDTFLDIGGNLGVFSLRMAPYLRQGKILAFEPQTRMRNLFSRSVFLNGYGDKITVHPWAVSDGEGEAELNIPAEAAGGASLENPSGQGERVQLHRLDDQVPEGFTCDLVKIDVEGHELHALRGMQRVLRRSPSVVVLFEKLTPDLGNEAELMAFAEDLGWTIYGIGDGFITPVTLETFRRQGGYFAAGRAEVMTAGGVRRNLLDIYPGDLNVLQGDMEAGRLRISAAASRSGTVLFHGPYWFVPRGYYLLSLEGEIEGKFQLDIQERFGYKLGGFELHPGQMAMDLQVQRDLVRFELVLKSLGGGTLAMERIRLVKLG
ncbi:MAG: FkbM family methyltransferase [Terriglobales bacterium]